MSIKTNRANKLWSSLPMAEREIWASIPQELIERLTGAELALVKQALNSHWHRASAWKEAQILSEGCIWDDKNQKLSEIN